MGQHTATRRSGRAATSLDVRAALQLGEPAARALLERVRWPDGAACPHCGGRDAVRFRGGSSRAGVHKCRACRRQFTVTVGTVLHGTRVPLNHWVAAFCLACQSRRGVSALELMERLSLGSYGTAWNMTRRMRATGSATNADGTSRRLSFAPRPLEDVLGRALRDAGVPSRRGAARPARD